MRCVCTAYVGSLFGDAGMIARAEVRIRSVQADRRDGLKRLSKLSINLVPCPNSTAGPIQVLLSSL